MGHSLTHLPTHSLARSLTHSLTHSLTNSLTHSHTLTLTHSLPHLLLQLLHHLHSHVKPLHALKLPSIRVDQPVIREDVDELQAVALASGKIVGVVCWGDLSRTSKRGGAEREMVDNVST